MDAMKEKTEENNFFEEMVQSVPNSMSRLAAFLSALWLTTTSAHPGFIDSLSNTATGVKNAATSELQASLDPVGKTIAFIGGSVCGHVKPIVGVAYENYDKEPDMSKLNLVFMNSAKTVMYNLTEAPTEFPKERWFDQEQPLLIFFHGFTDNPQKSSFQTMRHAVKQALGNVNILALDASSLIAFFYLRATTMVQFIGEHVGATLASLHSATGLNPSNIHLIGHSLGSHIAGFTGKKFFEKTGLKVGRITGLDPAGPCFGNVEPAVRLHRDDASFVDVIHSDAGVYGLDETIGHVDFYPNSGSQQPNCLLQTCSHSRAWELYAESLVDRDAFVAIKCKDHDDFRHGQCNLNDTCVMGYYTPTTTSGTYHLMTAGESPFGVGELGTTFASNGVVRGISYAFKDAILG